MSEETYRIKPLEWDVPHDGSMFIEYRASTLIGDLRVVFGKDDGETWWRVNGGAGHQVDSIEAGQSAAEAYYRSRLLSALEPVPCKETT